MATSSAMTITCEEILEFQESLKTSRRIDDRIIHALNTTVPTVTFEKDVNATNQCKSLYEKLVQVHDDRKSSITNCIKVTSDNVNALKEQRLSSPDDVSVLKELRRVQTNLRLMQSELTVEEVVRDRSLKVFKERCRIAYRPPKVPS
ncbi:coiled-coil domain-containing protein 58-like [Argonauta hians]